MKAVVSEKGQVTIPQKIRTRMGILPGQVLEFYEEDGRLVAVKDTGDDSLQSAFGVLKKTGVRTEDFMRRIRGRI